ncbi:MAG: flagellar biosynthesis protein FlhF [Gammaproteobacteria bacterium]|nr:MAG: flagellar biosynthesis protein FlhF [Gammaproteobacteria bacterium]
MKIKRFFATDMRQAIKMVREELGSDAVILSNKNVEGGVEIVAARDYDEQQIQARLQQQEEKKAILKNPVIKPFAKPTHSQYSMKPEATLGAKKPLRERREAPRQKVEWSQEPALVEMGQELKQIRKVIDARLSESDWMNGARTNPVRVDLLKRLRNVGFSTGLSLETVNCLDEHDDEESGVRKAQQRLANQLPIADDNLLEHGGVVALVGPTGVGKTTTIAKLAARYRLKYGSRQIALVTTDNYRIGAYEQLSTYGKILDVPVRAASTPEELDNVLNSFIDRKLVLIDTAGMGQRDNRLAQQFALFSECQTAIKSYLVLSAATQTRGLDETIKTFQGFAPQSCILTKTDEAFSLGAAVSSLIKSQLPLAWITDGQQVPEDLHIAHPNRLLNECFSAEDSDYNSADTFNYEAWVAQANV